jgi:hypothetical protein
MIGKLTITVTKTADGRYEYIQIFSPAAMPINIVLIADIVEIEDLRGIKPSTAKIFRSHLRGQRLPESEGPTP